jgi:hypothetical protein
MLKAMGSLAFCVARCASKPRKTFVICVDVLLLLPLACAAGRIRAILFIDKSNKPRPASWVIFLFVPRLVGWKLWGGAPTPQRAALYFKYFKYTFFVE